VRPGTSRTRRFTHLLPVMSVLLALTMIVAACDSNPAPMPAVTPTIQATNVTTQEADTPVVTDVPMPSASIVDAASVTPFPTTDADIPSPTPVTATSTGEAITALEALSSLKPKAVTWQRDSRLAMLANIRPGQQSGLLTGALGDPDVYEPTPGGRGRNWTIVVFSPSTGGAYAFSMDGTEVDLVKAGATTDVMHQSFSSPAASALELARLDTNTLANSDSVAQNAGELGKSEAMSLAMLAPEGFGMGPLPTHTDGGSQPAFVYEMFLTDPAMQAFILFDAFTGEVILDMSTP